MDVKYCPRCPFFSVQLTKVVTHIGLVHSAEPNFSVHCGINGCASNYRNFSSYRSHLYRCHRSVLEENGSNLHCSAAGQRTNSALSNEAVEASDVLMPNSECIENEGGSTDVNSSDPQAEKGAAVNFTEEDVVTAHDFQCFLAEARSAIWKFFFNVSEQHCLPHSAVRRVFSDLQLLFECVFKAYAGVISHAMQMPSTSSDLESLLKCRFVPELFSGIQSKDTMERYAKEMFPFVSPEEVQLSESAKCHYIPLSSLLSTLCAMPDIVAHLVTPNVEANVPTVYKDYSDGLLYREHLQPLMKENSTHTIMLLLYTDEIEIANPLGAKRGVHKLLAVYCSLLNLHVRYRSQLQNIYLVLLVRYKHVKSYGLDAVLRPLLNDLKHLHEQGLRFDLKGLPAHAQVLVFCICGDNLSLNRLGGFSTCFSSGRVCRFCMVLSQHLGSKTSESQCRARTASRHKCHLEAIAISHTNKRLYGVTEASPLLELPYFDVTRQLPPDIMHDILEGGAECVLRQVLRALLSSKFLCKQDLDEVTTFCYGPNDAKNKPPEISMSFVRGNAVLKGTASSKWCVVRFFPLIFGTKVPQGNEDWEVLLQFREIMDIIFSWEIPAERLAYLDVLVETFLTQFAERYGSAAVIPKLHYMIHYARFVREVGPLRSFWSMRFEAKHQEFKKLAARVSNYRNITLTLARRHQLRQSYQLHTFQLYKGLTTTRSKAIDQNILPACAKEALPANACQVQSATLDHCHYRSGSVVVVPNRDNPEFYEIESLFVADGKLYLLTRTLLLERFDRHRFCYCVKRLDEQQMQEPTEKFHHHLLDMYADGNIVPKWEIW